MRIFDEWFKTFRKNISGYRYYVDFDKVVQNAEKLRTELHILNSLIGRKDIEEEFRRILKDYPLTIRAIPILLAVRSLRIYACDSESGGWYDFEKVSHTAEEYLVFLSKTGLLDLISNRIINNLYDYVLGVESGLNSHARKNRGGDQMENLVEAYLQSLRVDYSKEMTASKIKREWGVDLAELTHNGEAEKRFDFAVRQNGMVYGVETNFYTSGSGSKLNEVARSYKLLAIESMKIPNFRFVWITDGNAWRTAKNNLKETFDSLPTLFNINDLEEGALKHLFNGRLPGEK